MPIKYLGSKRKLIEPIETIAKASGATTALDAFTGTTRVAQALKWLGMDVTASDVASYSKAFADCYIAIDADEVDIDELASTIDELMALEGTDGYFTQTFCIDSRFVQPKNGRRVDVMRETIEARYKDSWMYPVLLTSLIEATDRVDSTTGIQMAYLKKWAKRSYNDIELRMPKLIPGGGSAIMGDVFDVLDKLPRQNLVYLDPPYNQHRYYTNYHIWETLTRWDKPDYYGVACKRVDSKDTATKSDFNSKKRAPATIERLIKTAAAKCDTLVISYNDESWVSKESMIGMLDATSFDAVRVYTFDYDRYVGATIGIYDPSGNKVGKVDHTKNHERIFVATDDATMTDIEAAMLPLMRKAPL